MDIQNVPRVSLKAAEKIELALYETFDTSEN